MKRAATSSFRWRDVNFILPKTQHGSRVGALINILIDARLCFESGFSTYDIFPTRVTEEYVQSLLSLDVPGPLVDANGRAIDDRLLAYISAVRVRVHIARFLAVINSPQARQPVYETCNEWYELLEQWNRSQEHTNTEGEEDS